MGSRVPIRLFHIFHFVMHFLFPLLKNSKFGVDDRGHRLRICQAVGKVFNTKYINKLPKRIRFTPHSSL